MHRRSVVWNLAGEHLRGAKETSPPPPTGAPAHPYRVKPDTWKAKRPDKPGALK